MITLRRCVLLLVFVMTSFLSLSRCGVIDRLGSPAPASSIVGIWRLRSTTEIAPDGERTRRDTPTTVAQFTEQDFKINTHSKGSVGGRYVILDQEHLRLDFHYSDGTTEPTPVAIAITTRQLTMYWNSLSGNGTKIVEVYSRFQ